jgi:prepilin-type N-terminal cleavage/methylation domain-containing protein
MRAQSKGRAGFTLVEVLLTLVIMGMVLTMITQVLNTARTTRDTIHNLQENQLAGPAILDLIEGDLRALYILNRRPADYLRVKNEVKAGKEADALDFVSGSDSRVVVEIAGEKKRGLDVTEVGYRLRPNPDDDDFLEIWRRESWAVDGEPFDGGTYSFLHDRVKSFDVLVYAEDGPDADPWESWGGPNDENSGLPRRIEIELTLELAPRISREQLRVAPIDERTVTYRRIVRFPPALFLQQEVKPVPMIPDIQPPSLDTPSAIDGTDPNGEPPADGGPPPGGMPFDPGDLPIQLPDGTVPPAGGSVFDGINIGG